MTTTLRLAWRNLGRNRRRTLVTGTAVALSLMLATFSYGVIAGVFADILRSLTEFDTSHMQIHHRGFTKTREVTSVIPDPVGALASAREERGVVAASPRVYGGGLVRSKTTSAGALMVGVDPQSEPKVTSLHDRIKRGSYLPTEPSKWPEARTLTAEERRLDRAMTIAAERQALRELEELGLDDGEEAQEADDGTLPNETEQPTEQEIRALMELSPKELRERSAALARIQSPAPTSPPRLLMGKSLALVLDVDVGDRVTITTQTVNAVAQEVDFEVAGVFETGTPIYDRARVIVHVADLQRVLDLGPQVHEIAVKTIDFDEAAGIAASLMKKLGSADILVRDWQELRPDIVQTRKSFRKFSTIMLIIILLVASLGVINTTMMTVLERTREIGVMRALGMPPGQVLGMVLIETTTLVLIAAALGTAGGYGLNHLANAIGIDAQWWAEAKIGGLGLSPVLRPMTNARILLIPAGVLVVACFLGSLYPAIRAARLRPAEATREG
ncbi:MAG: FtsX-like permease family protein [Deltaproteobacteria bacterium]|nr:FtsX-like permease family protein [Deltaproteobacteria bacterium]